MEKKYTEKDIALAKLEGIRTWCNSKLKVYRQHAKDNGIKFNEDSPLGSTLNAGIKFANRIELKIRREE